MRWSLILSTFIVVQSALSFGCVALAIPPSSDELERRARTGARVSSKTYRKNSENHAYAYKFDQTGGVTREKLKEEDRPSNGKKRLMIPHTDADHVFEHQMFEKHLFQEHGLKFNDLHKDLRKEVTSIMNGAGNMAPVPSDVNRGKGQLVKQGMKGKGIAPKNPRDEYALLSYRTARKTAKSLDKAFKDHKQDLKDKTFREALRTTMENAKILKPGQPSPEGSSGSSSSGESDAGSAKAHPQHNLKPGRHSPARSSGSSSSGESDAGSAKARPQHNLKPGRHSPAGSSGSSSSGESDAGSAKARPQHNLKPGRHSSARSSGSSSSGASNAGSAKAGLQGSSHTHAANQATPKVMPPRRSARIAAKRTK